MQRCLDLAALGRGHVAPNPVVGAVIVHNNRIIGEGYHEKYGEAHAEVNAVNSVEDPTVLPESTIYVSLEPCAHFGKTPPCADLIVKHNFKRVVVGCSDSFDQVNGKGIQRLRDHGIEVTTFVLEDACREMNREFFTVQEKKRPFIFLKWAQSSDGFMDSDDSENGKITWISQPEIQPIVHQWRSEYHAILVGKNTIIRDNPSLTVRAVHGRNPIRIVLDSHNTIPNESKVLTDGGKTIILNTEKTEENDPVTYHCIDAMSVNSILKALYELGIQSVLIEGGAQTIQSFLDAGKWDEACVITGQSVLKSGTKAPEIKGQEFKQIDVMGDTLKFYRP